MPSPNQLTGRYPEHDRSEERRLGPRHILAIGDRKGTKFQARPARQRILQTRPAARGPWPRPRNCRLCFPRAWGSVSRGPTTVSIGARLCPDGLQAACGGHHLADRPSVSTGCGRRGRPAARGGISWKLFQSAASRASGTPKSGRTVTFGRDTGDLDPRIPRSIA